MTGRGQSELVLALYPYARGVSFALFATPLSPVDWGIKGLRHRQKKRSRLEIAKNLIDRFQPEVIVLPRRGARPDARLRQIDRMGARIATYATAQVIDCHRFTRADIRACFRAAGAVTRLEIASVIAAHVPAFEHCVPTPRKIWQQEDQRLGLFDAVSLVMTYFCSSSAGCRDELRKAA